MIAWLLQQLNKLFAVHTPHRVCMPYITNIIATNTVAANEFA